MSQEKAQLIAPLGNVTFTGVTATGVITATSLEGNITGSATSIKQGTSITAGVVTASSFAGNLTGNIQRLADSAPNISVGVVTATSFSGNLTGSVTDLTSQPAITVGVVTATSFSGPVTGDIRGNITGNVSGVATGSVTGTVSGLAQGGLGVNYNGGWTGAGTSQITAGVVTATSFYGDGSNLDGVSSGPVSQQAVTIDGASTSIDLSNGNLIYATQSANTTVSFANSENGNVYFVRIKDNNTTPRTITWPSRIKWDGAITPTLISDSTAGDSQIFKLVTRDEGVTWYGKEVFEYDAPYRELWMWGRNVQGALGQNDKTQHSSPVQVPGKWKQANAFSDTVMALKFDGSLWTWGNNSRGLLGQNAPQPSDLSSPTQVGTDTTWSNATGGGTCILAMKTNGTLWSWGYNYVGMLGQNSTAMKSSPTQVGTDTTWSQTTGLTSKYAIKTDGTIWSWGYNNVGGLGHNNKIDKSSPTQVGTNTTWSKVSTGHRQTAVAIKTDGTLWGWGSANNKVLNSSDTNAKSSPVQMGTDSNWKSVYQYSEGIQAFKTNGTLWMWGLNEFGQLGQNNLTNFSSPKQIPGTTWTGDAFTGPNFTLTTKTDGTLWVWGSNDAGQQGQNNTTKYSSPVQIPGTNWDYSKIFYQNFAEADIAIGIKQIT